MNVEDIKATVWDYTIDKCSEQETLNLQRYFIRQYMSWLPYRAIAEYTGASEHTTVIDSIRNALKPDLKSVVKALKKILDDKLHNYWKNTRRLFY